MTVLFLCNIVKVVIISIISIVMFLLKNSICIQIDILAIIDINTI